MALEFAHRDDSSSGTSFNKQRELSIVDVMSSTKSLSSNASGEEKMQQPLLAQANQLPPRQECYQIPGLNSALHEARRVADQFRSDNSAQARLRAAEDALQRATIACGRS